MAYTFSALLCMIFLCSFHAIPAARMQISSFVGVGYDLLKGNPEGDFFTGGIDPGFKFTRNVLNKRYGLGQVATYNGVNASLPNQLSYQPISGCSTEESTSVYSGTESYQKKLDNYVKILDGEDYSLFRYRFSLSPGYAQAYQNTQNRKQVMLDKTVACAIGELHYLTETECTGRSISDDFYYAVKKLPLVYNEAQYIQFIQEWGTHFVVGVTLGGRLISRYRLSYLNTYTYASEHIKSSVSAGGPYHGYSGSFKVDIISFNKHNLQSLNFGELQTTIASGSTIKKLNNVWSKPLHDTNTPIPISVKLEVITNAFARGLWGSLPESQTYTDIVSKLQHLQKALSKYTSVSNAVNKYRSDPTIQFPNAWPDGTYSLPKTTSGCPFGGSLEYEGSSFTWSVGFIKQDNEDNNNENSCPEPWYLSGYCNRNLKIDYCSKTTTNRDYGIKWPKGSYCFAKKGSCPQGFGSGYIYWDDEDSNNENDRGGIIPDGSYDRNTRIDYCCHNDAHPRNRITLPTDKPFFLLRYNNYGCQLVEGMDVIMQELKTDDEDSNNKNTISGYHPYKEGGHNHVLYYCYYY